jgi:hypothetical protein
LAERWRTGQRFDQHGALGGEQINRDQQCCAVGVTAYQLLDLTYPRFNCLHDTHDPNSWLRAHGNLRLLDG